MYVYNVHEMEYASRKVGLETAVRFHGISKQISHSFALSLVSTSFCTSLKFQDSSKECIVLADKKDLWSFFHRESLE